MTANRNPKRVDGFQLASLYLTAKETVLRCGYANEVDWQSEVVFEKVTESDFLREAAWVVLSAGFRESILRQRFATISTAFFEWQSAAKIVNNSRTCRRNALLAFRHEGKIDAILQIARTVAKDGVESIKNMVSQVGPRALQELPFIGPITSLHLAKNIGVNTAKPDRHLVRYAKQAGYESPAQLCDVIAKIVGDPAAVIDIVLWRFATIKETQNHLNSRDRDGT
jgi:hypothetical protein